MGNVNKEDGVDSRFVETSRRVGKEKISYKKCPLQYFW